MHKAAAYIVSFLKVTEYLVPFRRLTGHYSCPDICYALRNIFMLDADQCFKSDEAEQETEVGV